MYLNRIRPPKPKFAEEVTKAEFVPEDPVIKGLVDVSNTERQAEDVLDDYEEQTDDSNNLYALLPYSELRKLAAERGIHTSGNPKKSELVELLGGSDGQN